MTTKDVSEEIIIIVLCQTVICLLSFIFVLFLLLKFFSFDQKTIFCQKQRKGPQFNRPNTKNWGKKKLYRKWISLKQKEYSGKTSINKHKITKYWHGIENILGLKKPHEVHCKGLQLIFFMLIFYFIPSLQPSICTFLRIHILI